MADADKKTSGRITSKRWFRRSCAALASVAALTVAVLWVCLQPSLSRAFYKASRQETYSMTLKGKPFDMPYRIMVPEGVSPDGGYPVLLYLCGSGQCGTDNNLQALFDVGLVDNLAQTDIEEYRCIIIAPQIPSESLALDDEILAGYMGLAMFVQQQYGADPNRLYMAGFSMGGDTIWALLEKYPDMIAAAAPMCGGVLHPENASLMKDVAVWMFHGKYDFIYPTARARAMADALKQAGGNIQYTEYDFTGHVCWAKAYAEPGLLPWMFAQSKAQ